MIERYRFYTRPKSNYRDKFDGIAVVYRVCAVNSSAFNLQNEK